MSLLAVVAIQSILETFVTIPFEAYCQYWRQNCGCDCYHPLYLVHFVLQLCTDMAVFALYFSCFFFFFIVQLCHWNEGQACSSGRPSAATTNVSATQSISIFSQLLWICSCYELSHFYHAQSRLALFLLVAGITRSFHTTRTSTWMLRRLCLTMSFCTPRRIFLSCRPTSRRVSSRWAGSGQACRQK